MPPKYASCNTIGTSSARRRRPQRFEDGVVDGVPADAVGADDAGDEVVLLDAALELGHGERRILLRQQRDADEPARIGRAVLREPVVVGGAQRGRRLRVFVQART